MAIVEFAKRRWRPICRPGQHAGVRCRYPVNRTGFILMVVGVSLAVLSVILGIVVWIMRRRSYKKRMAATRGVGDEGAELFDSDKNARDDEAKPMLKKLRLGDLRLGDRLRGKKAKPVDPFSDQYTSYLAGGATNPFDEHATPRPSFQSVGYNGGGDTRTSLDQGYQYGQSPYTAVPNNAP